MNKNTKLFVILSLILVIGLSITQTTVQSKTAYKTRTVNRYGEFIDTQDAYTPVNLINSFNDGELFDGSLDMFIDEEDNLFIADTGNKRIVVLDEDYNFVRSIGEDILQKPMGIFVREDILYVADYDLGSIVTFNVDGTFLNTLGTPISPILGQNDFVYHPEKIAVDSNNTMYVVSEGSSEGLLQVNDNNRFLSFFAPNSVDGTFTDLVVNFFYGDNENANVTKKIPVSAHNVMLNDNGYIYTVSQFRSDEGTGDAIKKVNIGGENFFSNEMYMHQTFEDVWPGAFGNLYAVSSDGFIYEYDSLGNLLFVFAGNNEGTELPGLFSSASSIVVNSKGDLLVFDNNKNNIQVFRPTNFVSNIHDALVLYNDGRYDESIEPWSEVLRYNSLFDMAHRGIGLAHMRNGDYSEALHEFRVSNYKTGYSDAFWEMRNEWLLSNAGVVIALLALLQIGLIVYRRYGKQTELVTNTKTKINNFLHTGLMGEFMYMFYFLKNPNDAVYEVKRKNRVSYQTGFVIIGLLFLLYILHITFTGFLFNTFIIEETLLVQEIIKIFVPFVSFVIANFLISSLMEGEGTFKAIFLNTLGALTPILIIGPILIIVSNVLSYNEEFIYYFIVTIMTLYTGVMLFFSIKETHNMTTFQTFVNFLLTVLMMVVLVLVVIIVYILIFQVYSFASDIVKEVIISG